MSDVARTLLLKLLAQADRGGRETVPINESSANDYFSLDSILKRDSVHANLMNAEVAGAISLEWGKGAAAQDLLRIRLGDADKLAQWLGVPRARNYAELIDTALTEIAPTFPEWLLAAYEESIGKWRKGKLSLRVRAEDTDTAVNLFRIAYAVSRNEQDGLDLRRFSVRLLNDSKAIENLLSKLAPLLKCNPEWEKFEENFDLFRFLGLEKFAPPILIKGPLCIKYSDVELDIGKLRPYVGISPDLVSDTIVSGKVLYLLTIENLASFQRHVREIDDDGVVIYTAGFPSPSLVNVIKALDRAVPKHCPCYHWGDRDVGGIRIFSHIEKSLSKHDLRPHLMNEPSNERVFTSKERKVLEDNANKQGETGVLARYWLEHDRGPMEQEGLDPVAPVHEA